MTDPTWWILVERGSRLSANMPNLTVGPFADEQEATTHMQDSMQVESICQDGAEECWTSSDKGAMEALTAWTRAGEPFELYKVVKDDEDDEDRGPCLMWRGFCLTCNIHHEEPDDE